MTLTVAAIEQARRRLAGVIKPTPLMRSATLDRMLDAEVFLKLENLQKTGSFKIRGAYNRIAALTPDEAARGVIAASAGNHGQALAYAATRAGVNATIVMPTTAAIAKIDATRSYGQEVVLEGADYQAARAAAQELRERTGAIFVDAYDDPHVIAGTGHHRAGDRRRNRTRCRDRPGRRRRLDRAVSRSRSRRVRRTPKLSASKPPDPRSLASAWPPARLRRAQVRLIRLPTALPPDASASSLSN